MKATLLFLVFLLNGYLVSAQLYFDGLYEAQDGSDPTTSYYIRFFKDGSAQGVVSKSNSTEEVGEWFNYTRLNSEISKGFYTITGSKIEITTSFVRKDEERRYLTVDFLRGEIEGNGERIKLMHSFYKGNQVHSIAEVFLFNNFSH